MSASDPSESFVSEALVPQPGSFASAAMAKGEPGLPQAFLWRETEYRVARVLDTWRSSSPDRGGGSEMYLRKHWFRIETTSGDIMTIYFDRQPRRGRNPAQGRWTLYSWRARE